MRALRLELQPLLDQCPASRPPFLRRSLLPDWLLCTDLPAVAEPADVLVFLRLAEEAGWHASPEGGLIQLARLPEAPPLSDLPPCSGETACAVSLLSRHPGGPFRKEELFALLKASEEKKLEHLCADWHRDWAARLHRHEALPGELLPWLVNAIKEGPT